MTLNFLYLLSFITNKVISIYSMFEDYSSLTSIEISSFNTSLVTDMSKMFCSCRLFTSLNLKI